MGSGILDLLLWKRVYQYRHPKEGETVELHRHRLTNKTRRVWYEGLWYDIMDSDE